MVVENERARETETQTERDRDREEVRVCHRETERERQKEKESSLSKRGGTEALGSTLSDFMTGRGEDKGHSDESGSSLLYRDDVMRERDDGLY